MAERTEPREATKPTKRGGQGGRCETSPTDLALLERARVVLKMRIEGISLQAIADRVNAWSESERERLHVFVKYNATAALTDIRRALKEARELGFQNAQELVDIEHERLEQRVADLNRIKAKIEVALMQLDIDPEGLEGQHRLLKTYREYVEAAGRESERLCRMLGLNKPVQVDVKSGGESLSGVLAVPLVIGSSVDWEAVVAEVERKRIEEARAASDGAIPE